MLIMKKIVFILLSVLLLSCSLSNDTTTTSRDGKWSLINISGGIAGIEINLEKGQITWVFDEANNNLIVEVNIDDPMIGLSEGVYSFELKTINNEQFLFVNGTEFGALTVSETQLNIDQNITSTGSGADMYAFQFVR
jgi:hypothetical protein